MFERIIELMEEIAALSPQASDEARELAWSLDRSSPEKHGDVTAQLSGVGHIQTVVARPLALLGELEALPSDNIAEMIALLEHRNDLPGIAGALVLRLATRTPYSRAYKVGQTINLVRNVFLLPVEVVSRAFVLGGEMALPRHAAMAAIDWVTGDLYAVQEVEAWRAEGDMPNVLDISAYEDTCQPILDWGQYVRCCAAGAKDFIDIYSDESDVVFNCFWQRHEDVAEMS